MRPPNCFICDRSLVDLPFASFRTVRFALAAKEEASRRERDQQGRAGRLPDVEWFCDEHAPLAEEHLRLHRREARELLAQRERPPGRGQ